MARARLEQALDRLLQIPRRAAHAGVDPRPHDPRGIRAAGSRIAAVPNWAPACAGVTTPMLKEDFRAAAPAVDFCSLRFVEETSEFLQVRQDVAEPPQLSTSRGAMV